MLLVLILVQQSSQVILQEYELLFGTIQQQSSTLNSEEVLLLLLHVLKNWLQMNFMKYLHDLYDLSQVYGLRLMVLLVLLNSANG